MRKNIGNTGNAFRLIAYKRRSIMQDKINDYEFLNDTSDNSRHCLYLNCRSNTLSRKGEEQEHERGEWKNV